MTSLTSTPKARCRIPCALHSLKKYLLLPDHEVSSYGSVPIRPLPITPISLVELITRAREAFPDSRTGQEFYRFPVQLTEDKAAGNRVDFAAELTSVERSDVRYGHTACVAANIDRVPGETLMPPDRIEILFIIDYFHRTGGTENHLAQLVAGLPSELFHCSVLTFDLGENPLLDGLRARGVPIINLPVGCEYAPNAAVQAVRLWSLIRRNRYDIVQTFHQKADTYGALIARVSGVRYLISSKRDTGQLRKLRQVFFNRCLKSLFDAFIAVADGVCVAVVASNHLPAARVKIIYNGVDTARFVVPSVAQRAEARSRRGFAPDDFVVGMVAGFRPEKNHDVFFDGLLQALPSIPSLRVLAVGTGPLFLQFRERIARTELGPRIQFTGDVVDVLPYLWTMDVGCLTPGSNEGFSNAVIEQMAVGLPLIVTNVGGNAEAVVDGTNGWVIAPGNAVALCEALVTLFRDRARAAAMGCASRTRAEDRFSLQRMCAEHAKLYLSLFERQAGSTTP
jgi:glycosyltransferase involved in cell wall biosynthesis